MNIGRFDPRRLHTLDLGPMQPGIAESIRTRSEGKLVDDGTIDTTKGRIKRAAADLTSDDDLRREGKVDDATGTVKEKIGNAADKAKDALRDDDRDAGKER
jgi:uncharacterized protein YjbJ (UPF0337 family)